MSSILSTRFSRAQGETQTDSDASRPSRRSSVEEMPRKTHIEIVVDSPCVRLEGTGDEAESNYLSGHVVLHLADTTSIKEITLRFWGKAVLPAFTVNAEFTHVSYVVCSHDWSFLEGNKGHSRTLKAGRHSFPFQLRIGGSLPSSISTHVSRGASVTYKLRAHVVRTGFNSNLEAETTIPIVRSLPPDAFEYQQTLEVANRWREKLMYSVMVPHKAWAAGDNFTALVKFAPLVKDVTIIGLKTTLHSKTKIFTSSGELEFSNAIATLEHDISESDFIVVDGTSHLDGAGPSSARPSHLPRSSLSSIASSSDADTGSSSSASFPLSSIESHETTITMSLPSSLPPTHTFEPIVVKYYMQWSFRLMNPDGRISEVRCSLPLHILDHSLLKEARGQTSATRRLFFGKLGSPQLEEEDMKLPTYEAHVRDRVPDVCFSAEASFTPDNGTTHTLSRKRKSLSRRHSLGRRHGRDESAEEPYMHGNKSLWNLGDLLPSMFRPIPLHNLHAPSPRCPYSPQDRQHELQPERTDDEKRPGISAAYTQVPDYSVASLGFISGIPPLSSTQGLPSYEEAERWRPHESAIGAVHFSL